MTLFSKKALKTLKYALKSELISQSGASQFQYNQYLKVNWFVEETAYLAFLCILHIKHAAKAKSYRHTLLHLSIMAINEVIL